MIHYDDYVIELIEQDILRAYNDGKVDYTGRQRPAPHQRVPPPLRPHPLRPHGLHLRTRLPHGNQDGGGDGGVRLTVAFYENS